MRSLGGLGVAFVAVLALWAAWGSGRALAWTPPAASYGVGEHRNVTITAADGTVLTANVYYPTDKASGAEAAGSFPVILTQTPYGKDDGSSAGAVSAIGAGENDYLVERGYIQIVSDVRGTGNSEGEWGLFDPVQGRDGAAWVHYALGLPHSDGRVGLDGVSYLAINQFETAADSGPPGANPVKAMFPIVSANEIYRDTAFAGGFPDLEFDGIYLGLTGTLNTLLPVAEGGPTLGPALGAHVKDLLDFDTALLTNVETGGDQAYDGSYWQARSPAAYIPQIVRDRIPAYLIGGWYDLFLRGELLNYASFQNAYDGRPTWAAMTAAQRVTPRYQLLMGPWYHVTTGSGLDYRGLNLDGLQLAWFDHWLKGIDTGITNTRTPMHLEDLASGSYHEASRYPLDQASDRTYYLQPGGGLSPTRPGAGGGTSTLLFTGSEIPCTSSTDQWAMGVVQTIFQYAGSSDPCTATANLSELGPGTATFTTAPFSTPTTLAGPIGASLYAATTTRDAEWVVQLSDVAPDGQATSLTSGLLEGAQRGLDTSHSWYAPDGQPLLPDHPYTQASLQPIAPGQMTRFDVEVFPTDDTLEPGHRLRVTIATSDFPHVLPEVTQLPNLIGGVYTLDHNAAGPSSVELPLISGGLPASPTGPLAPARTRAKTRSTRR